ncbi:hypothetical protein ACDQ55_17420 [Chitinophaga sp. 30R24]|uniref:hypothetical protein n=1 Tax=Chitinophaga sp. 30R24 TaxID=3248838 RepID=UPI003B91C2A7
MEALVTTNNKVFIDYKYLIGISACLRQVDLSIDRCRWTSWNELRAFYKERTGVDYFFDFFINKCQELSLSPRYHESNSTTGKFSYIIRSLLLAFLKQKSFMTINELETSYYLLNEFKSMLRNESPDPKHVELIRFRIANYYTNILLPKLKKKDIDRVLKIGHYLQNESIETLSLNEIVGN